VPARWLSHLTSTLDEVGECVAQVVEVAPALASPTLRRVDDDVRRERRTLFEVNEQGYPARVCAVALGVLDARSKHSVGPRGSGGPDDLADAQGLGGGGECGDVVHSSNNNRRNTKDTTKKSPSAKKAPGVGRANGLGVALTK